MNTTSFFRRMAGSAMAAGLSLSLTSPSAVAQQSGATAPRVVRVGANFDAGSRSYLGVGIAEIDSERAKVLKLREERGVEITRVDEGSPAAVGGLVSGDVVLEYNGQRVEGIDQFARFVRETPVGREVKLNISRDGKLQVVGMKIGARKVRDGLLASMPRTIEIPEIRMPDFPRSGVMIWSSSALGVESEAVDGQLAEFFGVKEGVLVRSVIKGSAAEKAGLRAGDVLTKVDGSTVDSPNEVSRAMRSARGKKSVPVVLVRDKKEMTITVVVEDGEKKGENSLDRRYDKRVSFDGRVTRF